MLLNVHGPMHTYIYTYIDLYIPIYTYIDLYIPIYTYIHLYTPIYTNIYLYTGPWVVLSLAARLGRDGEWTP